MNSDEDDRPTQPKRYDAQDPDRLKTGTSDPRFARITEVKETPALASAPDAVDQLADPTGPAPGEPSSSTIDGASRPDKVAIAMMVGVVVLLLICVAFALAAR